MGGYGQLAGDNDKIDLSKYRRAVQKHKQDKFDHMLLLVMGPDGNLDRFRNVSDEHKEALFNLEKQDAEEALNRKIESRDKTIKWLRQDNLRRKTEKTNDDHKLAAAMSEAASSKSLLESNRQLLESRGQTIEAHEKTIESLQADIAAKEAELDAERRQLTSKEDELKSNKQALEARTAELQTAKDGELSQRAEKEVLQGEIETKENENKQLSEAVSSRAKTIANLEAELQAAKVSETSLTEQRDRAQKALQDACARSEDEATKHREETARAANNLQNTVEAHKAEMAELQRQHEDVARQLASEKKSLEARSHELADAAKELAGARRNLCEEESTTNALKGDIEELQASIDDEKQRHSSTEEQVKNLHKDIADEKQRHSLTEKQVESLREGVAGEKQRHSSTQGLLQKLQKDLVDEKQKHSSTVKQLQEELADEKRRHLSTEGQLQQRQQDLDGEQNIRSSTEEQLASSRRESRNKDLAIARFLMMQSGHYEQDVAMWTPLAEAMLQSEFVKGVPIGQNRPWIIARPWIKAANRRQPQQSGMFEAILKLYGMTVARDWDGGACDYLKTLAQGLGATEVAPLGAVMELLGRFRSADVEAQVRRDDRGELAVRSVIVLGFWQTACLTKIRWATAGGIDDLTGVLRSRAQQLVPNLVTICELLLEDNGSDVLKSVFRRGAERPDDAPVSPAITSMLLLPWKYCPAQDIGLLVLPSLRGHTWVFDLAGETIRLVKNIVGEFVGDDFLIEAPEGGEHVIVPAKTNDDLNFIFGHLDEN